MELEPKIRGRKTKSIRVEANDLKLLREELKATKEWAQYAEAADSELVRLAVMFARLHMQPDVFMLTTEAVQTLVDEAVRFSIADVARRAGRRSATKPETGRSTVDAEGWPTPSKHSMANAGRRSRVRRCCTKRWPTEAWKAFERRLARRVGGRHV